MTRERSHKPVAHPTAVKYAAEMIGTLFLVFTIGTAVRSGSPLAPPAIGAILMAMVYAGGHISGAHNNPAVMLGALVRSRIDVREAVGYWISQLIGALLGIGGRLRGRPGADESDDPVRACRDRGLRRGTACHLGAVLRRAECRHQQGSPRQLVLWAGDRLHRGSRRRCVGGISSGAFNPAVAVVGVAMGMFSGSMIWMFVAAQAIAAVAAGLAFRAVNPADK